MKIALAVPSYKGFVAVDHASSIQDLFLSCPDEIEWVRVNSVGCAVISRARNTQVAAALSHGCDAVLFVDDDIGFDPADVYRMISTGAHVIGAVCQRRNHHWNAPPQLAVSPQGMKYYPDLKVFVPNEPRLPMALTLIRSEVFHTMREKGLAEPFIYSRSSDEAQKFMATYFGIELTPSPEWSLDFHTAKRLGIENPMSEDGEDHYFCRRAAKAGYTVFIDAEAELRHYEGQVCHDFSIKKWMASPDALLKPVEKPQEQAA
jgi:glycosyltransferase involved in cell wall biosynthesis